MSLFQRRHYEAIAIILAKEPSGISSIQNKRESLIDAFCDWFAADNHNFDKDRFLNRINALRGKQLSKHLCYHMVALWVDEINPMKSVAHSLFMERRGKTSK